MRPGLRGPLGASAAGQTLPRPLPVMQLLDTGGETGVTLSRYTHSNVPLRAAGTAQGGRAQGSGRLRARQPRRGELTPHTALTLQAGTSFPADLALASAATPGTGPAPVSGRAGPVLEAQVAARLCGEHRPERRCRRRGCRGAPPPCPGATRVSACGAPPAAPAGAWRRTERTVSAA